MPTDQLAEYAFRRLPIQDLQYWRNCDAIWLWGNGTEQLFKSGTKGTILKDQREFYKLRGKSAPDSGRTA